MSVNKATILGSVGNEPKISKTQDGREIASFSVATSEKWKDKSSGEKREKTEWHRVVVFSQGLIGIIKNYVKKGSKLYLEGQLQTRKWSDQSGVDHYTTEIVLNNFGAVLQLLDSANRSGEPDGARANSSSQEESVEDFEDSEIPF